MKKGALSLGTGRVLLRPARASSSSWNNSSPAAVSWPCLRPETCPSHQRLSPGAGRAQGNNCANSGQVRAKRIFGIGAQASYQPHAVPVQSAPRPHARGHPKRQTHRPALPTRCEEPPPRLHTSTQAGALEGPTCLADCRMVVRRLRTAVSAISSFYAFRPELLALGVSSIPCLCQLNSTPTCRLTFRSSNRAWEAPSWGQGLGLDYLELYRGGNRASSSHRAEEEEPQLEFASSVPTAAAACRQVPRFRTVLGLFAHQTLQNPSLPAHQEETNPPPWRLSHSR